MAISYQYSVVSPPTAGEVFKPRLQRGLRKFRLTYPQILLLPKNFSSVCEFGGFVSRETIISVTDETAIRIAAGIIPVPPTLYPGVRQFWRKK